MSDKELSRINIIQSVVEKRMRRRDAAHQLALTERQTQRLMNRFRESGAAGLANLRRGRPGNHRLPESLKLSELGIELICANSPQAKGRVERANQTLQDRLIKEMRLEGIITLRKQ